MNIGLETILQVTYSKVNARIFVKYKKSVFEMSVFNQFAF